MFKGYIYKITNKINNKIYIGQVYNKSINDRFKRHINEASKLSRSYVDRAINKYGSSNFICEEIDTGISREDLNQKEIYWIAFFKNTHMLYNLTKGGDGGNTYLCKTEEELNEIRKKISIANKGIKNANSKQIKTLNIKTNEIMHFECVADVCKYFNIVQKHDFILRCEHKAKYYWRNEWNFAYENDEFIELQVKPLHKKYNIKPCILINKINGTSIKYKSKYSANVASDLKRGELENEHYKIIVID